MAKYKIYKKIIIFLSIMLLIVFLVLGKEPIVQQEKSSNSTQVKEAKNTVKKIFYQFSAEQTLINVVLSQSELDALMSVASHAIPSVNFNANLSPFGLTIAASKSINLGIGDFHFNFYCLMSSGIERFEIDRCELGNIPLSGWLIKSIAKLGTYLLFGKEVQGTVIGLFDNAKLKEDAIILTSTKSSDFKEQVNSSLKSAVSIIRTLNNDNNIDKDLVTIYLHTLNTVDMEETSLSFYIQKLFQLAKYRSVNNDPIAENTAALWALAITYGSRSFGRFVDISPNIPHKKANKVTLRGRTDLRLHFLYSVFLEQVGKAKIGLKIGELKELLDTNKGGSGFSFADLAADKAGLLFAQKLTSNKENAIKGQSLLASDNSEDTFFPFIHDLPEGFKENEFREIFQDVTSSNYKLLELDINKRIESLSLHSVNLKKPTPLSFYSVHDSSINNNWFIVDTHIHSKYSDGKYAIKDIAEKASKYGCDAIAITDHGDINLQGVLSKQYFNDIEQANFYNPHLTVIPALEWNIPPFMGREHATVLLPMHQNTARDLSTFRNKFDSWGRRDEQLLSAKEAFKWLDENTENNGNKPVVFYNHPNRKGSQTEEIRHNYELWSSFNNTLVGFSGSPGHQRKRDSNNGSYEYKLKTENGWDPSVANIGGEWDQLLQQGYSVWAARAPSDFHNTKIDYWPCQFSTTHVFAKSKEHNDIIRALQSGSFWGQHGKFIKTLDFKVNTRQAKNVMGDSSKAVFGETVKVSLNLQLSQKDWQNFEATLDEVELIIITPNKIESIKKFPQVNLQTGKAIITIDYKILDSSVIFRWRGRSIQPEKHHYMFYTNPIRLTTQQN